jgi:hypothetical protein
MLSNYPPFIFFHCILFSETHARRTREKDRDLKTLKKAELQHKVAEENLIHTRSVNEKTKAQV